MSTEDQVDHLPHALKRARCRQYARQQHLGAVTVVADEGWSGRTWTVPGARRLLELVQAEQVAHVIVWRLDRLSEGYQGSERAGAAVRAALRHLALGERRASRCGDSNRAHAGRYAWCVAQFQREQIVRERQDGDGAGGTQGRWLNRPPTGYDMVNGELVPNEVAALVQRIFELRARGASYAVIEGEVGISYSTVRQILHNRVYLGKSPAGPVVPGDP